MAQEIINFLKENSYLLAGALALVLILIIFIRRTSYEHIRCKVIEDGRYRYTDVYRNRRTNIYKVHSKDGRWIILKDAQVKRIEEIREKFAKRIKYDKQVTPEFNLFE